MAGRLCSCLARIILISSVSLSNVELMYSWRTEKGCQWCTRLLMMTILTSSPIWETSADSVSTIPMTTVTRHSISPAPKALSTQRSGLSDLNQPSMLKTRKEIHPYTCYWRTVRRWLEQNVWKSWSSKEQTRALQTIATWDLLIILIVSRIQHLNKNLSRFLENNHAAACLA